MRYEVTKKSGAVLEYSDTVPLIRVLDESGDIYHVRRNASKMRLNLFPGVYYIEPNPIEITPVNWLNKTPLFKLPDAEKKFENFDIENIEIKTNEILQYTPARTCVKKGLIELSPRIFEMPRFVRMFIMLHELGHNMYITEWKCDVFALYVMMKKGCSISQCFYALDMVMKPSDAKDERLKKIYSYIKKIKTHD